MGTWKQVVLVRSSSCLHSVLSLIRWGTAYSVHCHVAELPCIALTTTVSLTLLLWLWLCGCVAVPNPAKTTPFKYWLQERAIDDSSWTNPTSEEAMRYKVSPTKTSQYNVECTAVLERTKNGGMCKDLVKPPFTTSRQTSALFTQGTCPAPIHCFLM